MKTFSTKTMGPEKKMRLFGNLLGSIGNENICACHIKYFEDKVLDTKENENKDITLAPNYYAWLFLVSSDHTFWLVWNFCFNKPNWLWMSRIICFELIYNELVTKFCDVTREIGELRRRRAYSFVQHPSKDLLILDMR